jgi:hypothetical protein
VSLGDNARFNTLGIQLDRMLVEEALQVNPQFKRIINQHLPRFIEKFADGAIDYRDDGEELGIKAQFVDLNRKLGKLRRFMWEGIPLRREQPDEVIMDLIAHLFLTLDLLSVERPGIELKGAPMQDPEMRPSTYSDQYNSGG